MRFEVIDAIHDERRRRFLDHAPEANVFHQPAWLDLLRRQYGYELAAWCLVDDGAIAAGVPVARVSSRVTGDRLIALPFSDVCPTLARRGRRRGISSSLARALDCNRERMVLDLEVRGPLQGLSSSHVVRRFYGHRLALHPDMRAVEALFLGRARRGVAKARRAGLNAERRTDLAALRVFYALHMRTRRRQGMPTQPRRFILRFAELFAADLGFVLLTRLGERCVAAAVFLAFNGTLTYTYGASDVRFLDRRPNNLLFMEPFVGPASTDSASSTSGARTSATPACAASSASGGRTSSRCSIPTWARTRIIRRSPPVVGRLVGEALYKHFA